jgi:hypothetical protein
MGRPIYSLSFAPTAPVVRDDSPPPTFNPVYEKWTYWNPFDPDSDEFFENDAVYEAFIDLPAPSDRPSVVPIISPSPTSSEGTLTESGSPVSAGADDPTRSLPEIYRDFWALQPQQQPTTPSPPDVPASDALSRFPFVTYVPSDSQPRPLSTTTRPRSATVTVLPQRRLSYSYQHVFDGLPRTSNITPITIPARTTVSHLPPLADAPSGSQPVPTQSSTPRILAWTSTLPPPSAPPPAPVGPLTNPSARMSLTHIAPTLIRVRDVVI